MTCASGMGQKRRYGGYERSGHGMASNGIALAYWRRIQS